MPIPNEKKLNYRILSRSSLDNALRRFAINPDRRSIPVSLILYRIILLLSVVASIVASIYGVKLDRLQVSDSRDLINGQITSFCKEEPLVSRVYSTLSLVGDRL